MRRLAAMAALVLALFALPAYADDGSSMRADTPTTDRELTAR